MKKLLSLLSVLTISGTNMPVLIFASSYEKQENSTLKNLKINKSKNVIITNGEITSSGVVLNNKLYFGSGDHNVYEYDPVTNTQKIVIRTGGEVDFSGAILNNKVYFGSNDHNVYEYDPVTGYNRVIIITKGEINVSGTVFENKVYFGSNDHNVYEYDPVTNTQKIVITTSKPIFSSGVVLNNKLYFGSTDYNVYEYDPVTEQQKIVIRTNGKITSSGMVLNNKLYFGSTDYNVYEYDPVTNTQKIVIRTNKWISSSGVVLNNKVYFGSTDYNVYEYDPVTEQQKIVIRTNKWISSSGVVLNNKVYFGSNDHNVYEYDPVTEQQKIVITTSKPIFSSGVVLNNKVYFGSTDYNVYEYSNYSLNLGKINNISDNLILNELNYLKPDLDISQLKITIIRRNENEVLIKDKNDLSHYINIKYSINNNKQNKIVNLNELIKRAVFFKYRDENPNLKFKEINYLDINNLNFENVELTRNEKLNWNIAFKNVCFSEQEIRNNNLIKKTYYIPKCEYNQKIQTIFQIITGLSKNEKNNLQTGWILNMDDENKLVNFLDLNYRDQTIIYILSNEFDFTNLNKQEQEMIFVFNEPEDKIELDPNEKATFSYSVRENKYEANLNLKQKINGNIIAIVITGDNEEKIFTLSIKEAMQILQKYSLLPDEISINEDNSVTFNGKAIFSRISESKPKLILKTEII